jgi:hypothetical protein
MIFVTKYKHVYTVLVAALGLLVFQSCEKEITVDLPQPEPKIVVEGYIFSGLRPYVMLSKNSPYFAPIDSAALANSIIYDALVIVSDGVNTDTLTFQPANEAPLKFAYIKQNGTVIGQAGKTYTLFVVANGDTVTSTTQIIASPPIDSLHWVPDTEGDTLGLVWVYFQDPGIDERGYRFMSRRKSNIPKRNDRIFRPNTLLLNQLFWGQNYSFGIGRPDKYADGLSEDNYDHADRKRYRLGDTVRIRLCSIDLPAYNFFNSVEQSMDDNNSPFASPNNVISNINGGLGCWVGYGVSEKQVVCFP